VIWFTPVRYSHDASGEPHPRYEFLAFSEVAAFPITTLLVPVVLAACAIWLVKRHGGRFLLVVALGLSLYALVTGFSIGVVFLPAAVVLLYASLLEAQAEP
jgi:hypothetical protein